MPSQGARNEIVTSNSIDSKCSIRVVTYAPCAMKWHNIMMVYRSVSNICREIVKLFQINTFNKKRNIPKRPLEVVRYMDALKCSQRSTRNQFPLLSICFTLIARSERIQWRSYACRLWEFENNAILQLLTIVACVIMDFNDIFHLLSKLV